MTLKEAQSLKSNRAKEKERSSFPHKDVLTPYFDRRFNQESINSHSTFNFANIQTKLEVSQPGDIYEQEADGIAEDVIHDSTSTIEHHDLENKSKVRRSIPSSKGTNNVPIDMSDGATPLDSTTLGFMETRFGYDFSNVRVHTNEDAEKAALFVNALAYTLGNHIVFAKGRYSPNTIEGKGLLAHELTHVVQQTRFDNYLKESHIVQRQKAGLSEKKPDTVQDISWVNVQSNIFDPTANRRGIALIGQIFFATDSSKLEEPDDYRELLKIVSAYFHLVSGKEESSRRRHFLFLGYADHRDTKEHNYRLSQDRAESVDRYLREQWLGNHANYIADIRGLGKVYGFEHLKSSEQLASFRRVDIYAEPIRDIQPPELENIPEKAKVSKNWKARLLLSGTAGEGYGGGGALVEVVDLDNELGMKFIFKGAGLTVGSFLTAGYEASGWYTFKTKKAFPLQGFEGWAFYPSVQLTPTEVGPGASSTVIILTGPFQRGLEDSVIFLKWPFEKGLQGGSSISGYGGTFKPLSGKIYHAI